MVLFDHNNISFWLAGILVGTCLSIVQLFLTPWLNHFLVLFSFFHFMHHLMLYGILTVGIFLLFLPVGNFAAKLSTVIILPVPFSFWINRHSLLSSSVDQIFWVTSGIYLVILLLIFGVYRILKSFAYLTTILTTVFLLGFGMIVRVTGAHLVSSSWVLKRVEPTTTWSLSNDPSTTENLLYPFSQSLYSLRNFISFEQPLRKSVIVLVPDALRGDYVREELFGQKIAPNMDNFGNKNIRFENYRVQSTWTKPSVASFFTGRYVRDHGVFWGGKFTIDRDARALGSPHSHVLPDRYNTVAERLKDDGYKTLGFTINFLTGTHYNFDQGFDTYLGPTEGFHNDLFTLDQTIFWLKRNLNRKKFIYLHTGGVHWPYPHALQNDEFINQSYFFKNGELQYQPKYNIQRNRIQKKAKRGEIKFPNSDKFFYRTLYASQLNFYDRQYFERLKTFLDRINFSRSSLFVVTSDHGELLFEHDRFGHGQALYEEIIKVPLIIEPPSEFKTRDASIMMDGGSIDLTATVLDFAGISSDKIQGKSFLPLLENSSSEERLDNHTISEHLPHGMRGGLYKESIQEATIVDHPWKYLYDYEEDEGILYNLKNMEAQKNHVENTKVIQRMRKKLFEELGSDGSLRVKPVELKDVTPSSEENLRNLGYIE